jgi:hypothetical protein
MEGIGHLLGEGDRRQEDRPVGARQIEGGHLHAVEPLVSLVEQPGDRV